MNRFLIILALASLACGATLPESKLTGAVPTAGNPTPEASAEMVVTGLFPDEPLNIRNGAGGDTLDKYLHNGDVVTIYHAEWNQDVFWCAIEPDYTRWVACRYLEGK